MTKLAEIITIISGILALVVFVTGKASFEELIAGFTKRAETELIRQHNNADKSKAGENLIKKKQGNEIHSDSSFKKYIPKPGDIWQGIMGGFVNIPFGLIYDKSYPFRLNINGTGWYQFGVSIGLVGFLFCFLFCIGMVYEVLLLIDNDRLVYISLGVLFISGILGWLFMIGLFWWVYYLRSTIFVEPANIFLSFSPVVGVYIVFYFVLKMIFNTSSE